MLSEEWDLAEKGYERFEKALARVPTELKRGVCHLGKASASLAKPCPEPSIGCNGTRQENGAKTENLERGGLSSKISEEPRR